MTTDHKAVEGMERPVCDRDGGGTGRAVAVARTRRT
jgi:hypothetical protein